MEDSGCEYRIVYGNVLVCARMKRSSSRSAAYELGRRLVGSSINEIKSEKASGSTITAAISTDCQFWLDVSACRVRFATSRNMPEPVPPATDETMKISLLPFSF